MGKGSFGIVPKKLKGKKETRNQVRGKPVPRLIGHDKVSFCEVGEQIPGFGDTGISGRGGFIHGKKRRGPVLSGKGGTTIGGELPGVQNESMTSCARSNNIGGRGLVTRSENQQ